MVLVVLVVGVDLLLSTDLVMADAMPYLVVSLSVCGGVALWWRRRYPVGVAVVELALTVVGLAFVPGYRPFVALVVAIHGVARWADRRRAMLVIVASVLPFALVVVQEAATIESPAQVPGAAATAVVLGIVVAAAWGFGRRGARAATDIEQLTEEREARARAAVAEERRRMAGELHDIVAHSVTAMTMQAAGGRAILAEDPVRAAAALEAIEANGVATARELRRLLSVIDVSATPTESIAPDPEVVAETARAAGLTVDLRGAALLADADPGIALTAGRVVQEGLTNAMRYVGRGGVARVDIDRTLTDWVIEVVDEGPTDGLAPHVPDVATGHGLATMRERVRAVGGRLDAGPRPDRTGWQVRAWIPLEPATSETKSR